jgi:AcrR family transcriptional regulator
VNRKYVLKRRAQRQQQTRRRIVEATVELHRTVGPAETTFSAVAALARVQRHTLYSHFPNQEELFKACSAHFLAQNSPPNTSSWLEVLEPGARLRHGLTDLYAYYEAHEDMISRVLRDSEKLPVGAGFNRLQATAVEALAQAWATMDDQSALLPALQLATSFACWRTLARNTGMTTPESVHLVAMMVECVAGGASIDG